MQFELSAYLGRKPLVVVEFTGALYRLPHAACSSLILSLNRIGGKVDHEGNSCIFTFPVFVTRPMIEEIIHNTCFVCGGLMQNAILLENGKHCISEEKANTSNNSKAIRKCSSCGHSHT